jgi:cyanophycinase
MNQHDHADALRSGAARAATLAAGAPSSVRASFLLVLLAAALLLAGCGSGRSGRLIIAGGATADDNATIWRTFAESAGNRPIGIVAAATSVPEESVANARKAMIRHGTPADRITELPLRNGDTASAESAETVRLIENLGAVWFVGGDQNRITATLINNGAERPALAEIRRLVASRAGVVGGTSAGAAMMSTQMLTGGDSDKWLTALLGGRPQTSRNRPSASATTQDRTVDPADLLDQGLGFVDTFLTDQHFSARGRYGRLAVALIIGQTKFGIGIEENSAISVDVLNGQIRPLGDRAAVLMDASRAVVDRSSGTISGIRVSMLGDDDLAIASAEGVRLAPSTRAMTRSALLNADPAEMAAPPLKADAPFAKGVLPDALLAAARSRTGTVTLNEDRWTVTFIADERTSVVGTGPRARARDIELRIARR